MALSLKLHIWGEVMGINYKVRDYFEDLSDNIETAYKSLKMAADSLKKQTDEIGDYWKGNTANLYKLSLSKKAQKLEILDYRLRVLKKRIDFKVDELTDYLEKKNERDKAKAWNEGHYIDYGKHLWNDLWDEES